MSHREIILYGLLTDDREELVKRADAKCGWLYG